MTLIPGYLLGLDLSLNQLVACARQDDIHVGRTSKFALANQSKTGAVGGRGNPSYPPLAQIKAPVIPHVDCGRVERDSEYGARKIGDLLKTLRSDKGT